MKKIYILCGLLLGLTGFSYSMDQKNIDEMNEAISTKAWIKIGYLIADAKNEEYRNQYIQLLVNTTINLNEMINLNTKLVVHRQYLLGNLLEDAVSYCNDAQGLNNIRIALTQLIFHKKLDPEIKNINGVHIFNVVDNFKKQNNEPVGALEILKEICLDVWNTRRKNASPLHTYKSKITPEGLTLCTVAWTPYCLLTDYRFWVTWFVGIIALKSLYTWYTRQKTQDTDDETQEQEEVDQTQPDDIKSTTIAK